MQDMKGNERIEGRCGGCDVSLDFLNAKSGSNHMYIFSPHRSELVISWLPHICH